MLCLLACVAERWLLNHVVTYFLGSIKTYRGSIDADHHQITYIGQQQCRSLVRAYIVHETKTPFTLSHAARDGLHASYERFHCVGAQGNLSYH